MSAIVTTNCPDLELIARGKVRDLYRVDANSLLFVATDRISAFDVIMKNVWLHSIVVWARNEFGKKYFLSVVWLTILHSFFYIIFLFRQGITNKGKLLTEISIFWFSLLKDVLPNHLITANFDEMPVKVQQYRDQLEGRSMLVKSLRVLPIESIVRGYITGKSLEILSNISDRLVLEISVLISSNLTLSSHSTFNRLRLVRV